MHALVASVIAQFESLAHDRGITLHWQAPKTMAPLVSDESKLRQVLFNLLGNAIKFTERGSVTLSVATDPGTNAVEAIRVQDTGIGIPADRIGAIFEPFEQADNTTSRRFGGTGLGLAISRSLSEMLGYTLTAASEVGRGTIFTIAVSPAAAAPSVYLASGDAGNTGDTDTDSADTARVKPVVDTSAANSSVAETNSPDTTLVNDPLAVVAPPAKPIVLVIDDDSDSRILLVHCAEELGCEVVTAHSGEDGIRLATLVRPSLITLDLMMPEMDGWETLRRLKKDPALRDIPVVVVSMAPADERGLVIGAADCLDKAASHDVLLATLRSRLPH
jgi:CheY-like chemotaxis protein